MRPLVLILLIAGLIAGCGDDDDDSSGQASSEATTTEQAPTKAEFIRQADRICGEGDRELAPILETINTKAKRGDIDGVVAEYRKAEPIIEEQLAELRKLTPPDDDEETVSKYLDSVAEGADLVPRLLESLEDEDKERAETLGKEAARVQLRSQRLARGYGFKECASGD